MKVKGYIINPDFSKETKDINDVLSDSLSKLNFPQPIVQYVYWPEPDGIMHQYGTYSNEAKEAIRDINDKVERYSQALPLDTILIISADHGHTPVKPINIYNCEVLNRYLKTKPSNDSRCVVFRVKDGMGPKFEKMFNSLFGEVFTLLPSKDAIKMGYFGDPNGHIHQRIEDFLGDYVAIATNQFYLNSKENNFIFKSHHAGITKDEMEVPVIVIRKY
jgi:predicted AlkP superfamily pyrophosphatase or phosphodiesterase